MNEASKTAMRQRILIGIALTILGIYAMVSFSGARAASQRLSRAQSDLQEIKQKLADIDKLSEAPSIAALNTEEPGAIIKRINAALKAAGIPQNGLKDQSPLPPQPITGTDYDERKTTIQLQPSSLSKIVKFCEELRDEETGSVVTQLSLTTPTRGGNNAIKEDWEVNLTLTQTIYSPKSQ